DYYCQSFDNSGHHVLF
nr:immunoglobulin light chain junction region [Macaca mulatta]MOW02878.1 immunoglobulin light chain junction region [Macaca mulatta]MOW03227.1 immunoglobulin light chain junction region [Macaca mulatta]